MPQPAHYLRTHVLQAAAEGKSLLSADLSQAKVCDFEVSFEIDHDVLGLEVAIEYVLGMQVLYRQQHFNEVSSRLCLAEPRHLLLQMEQLSPRAVVQNHYVKLLSLKELAHVHQKGESDALVDLPFVDNQVHLAVHFSLFDKLGSVELSIAAVAAEIDLAEPSHADALEHIVRIHSPEFLVLINFEHCLKIQVTPHPALPVLQLIVSEPVRISSLQICHPARQASQ